MLATLAGFLALLLGLSLLLLPLLVTELSRPRDSAWGAVVLLLGLVLVTSSERLTGAPMLAVLCGGLLVGRLGGEVAQGRWRALSDEERQALRSAERWSRSLNQLAAVAASLVQSAVALAATVSAWLAERRQGRAHGKRWVRAETLGEAASEAPAGAGAEDPQAAAAASVAAGEPASGLTAPPGSKSPDVLSEAPASDGTSGPEALLEGDAPAEPAARPAAPEATLSAAPERKAGAAAESPAPLAPGDLPAAAAVSTPRAPGSEDPGVRVVADFDGIDALLAAAPAPEGLSQASEASTEASIPPSAPGPDA